MGSQVIFPLLWEYITKGLYMEKFGDKLKALRKEAGLGQIALANALEVGKSVISLWELNKADPTLTNLIKIAKYFQVSIDYLAGLED